MLVYINGKKISSKLLKDGKRFYFGSDELCTISIKIEVFDKILFVQHI